MSRLMCEERAMRTIADRMYFFNHNLSRYYTREYKVMMQNRKVSGRVRYDVQSLTQIGKLMVASGACQLDQQTAHSTEVPIEYRPLMCESVDANTGDLSTISKGQKGRRPIVDNCDLVWLVMTDRFQ